MFSRDFDRMMRQQQRRSPQLKPINWLGQWRPNQQPCRPTVQETFKGSEPPEREPDYEPADSYVRILGLDLGQMKDPAAAVMISRRKFDRRHPNRQRPVTGPIPPEQLPVEVDLIHEWQKGTDYNDLVQFCLNLHEIKTGANGQDVKEPVKLDAIVFDMTGCGHPFRDFFLKEARTKQFATPIIGINLSSSDTTLKVRNDVRGKFMTVAKLEMLTAVNILAQQKLLRYQPGWSTKKLFEQMQTFQIKKTPSANITFEQGGQGHHGDAVIALGLACFYIQRGFRELTINQNPAVEPPDLWQPIRAIR